MEMFNKNAEEQIAVSHTEEIPKEIKQLYGSKITATSQNWYLVNLIWKAIERRRSTKRIQASSKTNEKDFMQ